MSNYHGYWFYALDDDTVIQAKTAIDEYCLLNCPQSVVGPFKTEADANLYRASHPDEHTQFVKMLKDMEEFFYGN